MNSFMLVTPLQAEMAGQSNVSFIIMMVLIFVVMYFFMIRPQQKRQKELVKFREGLKKGDKVITAGGIYGSIKEVGDSYLVVDIDNNVSIKVDKNMIMQDPATVVAKK